MEMPVVLAKMYELRISEIIGLQRQTLALKNTVWYCRTNTAQSTAPETKTIAEMTLTKSNVHIFPITGETLLHLLLSLAFFMACPIALKLYLCSLRITISPCIILQEPLKI